MSKKAVNPLMAEQKKKHHLWGLWIPLILIFTIVVLPVGMALALFYDSSHIDVGLTDADKKSRSEIFTNVMTDMFDGCRNEKDPTIDLVITQKQLNALLIATSEESNSANRKNAVGDAKNQNDIVKQVTILIQDDSRYTFDIEISVYNLLNTHIAVETKVTPGVVLPNGQKGFVFKVTDLKAGRLRGIEAVLPWLSEKTGLDLGQLITSATGLKVSYDSKAMEFIYTYSDFVDNLSSMAKTSNSFFISIFKNFFVNDKVNFTHNADENVHGVIDMNPYLRNTDYRNDYFIKNVVEGTNNTPMLTYYSEAIQSLLKDGALANDENTKKNTAVILKFLAFGEDFLSKSKNEDEYIESIYPKLKDSYCGGLSMADYSTERKNKVFDGKTSAGLLDKVTEKLNGIVGSMTTEEKNDFVDDAKGGKAYLIGGDASHEAYVVDDATVHTMVKANKGIVGYGFAFLGSDASGNPKLSYNMLDNCYPTIVAGKDGTPDMMSLNFGLNINGTETTLAMPMVGKEYKEGGKIGLTFNMKDAPLYYGDTNFPDLKEQIQEIMNSVTSTDDEGMIQFYPASGDVEEIRMVFDFDDWFSKNSTSQFALLNADANDKGAELFLEFKFVSTLNPADPNNHRGEFDVAIGYKKIS